VSPASIASLTRRAAAGEVNARDELAKIGHGATPGYNIIERARAGMSSFGGVVGSTFSAIAPLLSPAPTWGDHPEDSKPALPQGALAGLGAIGTFPSTVLRCRKFKDGEWACAIVIASGPALDATQVAKMATAMKLSGMQTKCFMHAVQHPNDKALEARVGQAERGVIAVGRCVGRARLLQAAQSVSKMGGVDRVIGWELGEP
jgi:hypothetical protein